MLAQENSIIDADLPSTPQIFCPAPQPAFSTPPDSQAIKSMIYLILPTLSTLVSNAITAATASLQQQVEALRGELSKLTSSAPVMRPSAMAQPSTTVVAKRALSCAGVASQSPAKAQDRKARISASVKQPMTEDEIERFFTRRPLNGVVRAIIYVSGTGRRPFWQLRKPFTTAAIEQHWVQHMSFIGNNVLELVVLKDKKQAVIDRLAKWHVNIVRDFDPLCPACSATPLSEGAPLTSEGERRSAAKAALLKRIDASLATIPQSRLGLRSFLQSLRKAAAANSADIARFVNPDAAPKPTLLFDITQTKAYADQLRAGNQQVSRESNRGSPVPEASNIRMCGPSGLGTKRTLPRREDSLEAAIEHALAAQREDLTILEREGHQQPAALPSGSAQ